MPEVSPTLSVFHTEDIKLAASKMLGAERRSFQAAMTMKYCSGNARLAEKHFGWGRETVTLGLAEARTGLTCFGAHALRGNKPWEEKHPEAATALFALAETHAQQDPTFRSAIAYTRLTAAEALKQLRAQGFVAGQLPSPSSMAEILNRNGYRLRSGQRSPKKIQKDAIFDNIKGKAGPAVPEVSNV